jgi:hypothetical protein
MHFTQLICNRLQCHAYLQCHPYLQSYWLLQCLSAVTSTLTCLIVLFSVTDFSVNASGQLLCGLISVLYWYIALIISAYTRLCIFCSVVAKIDVQNEFYVYQGSGSNEVKYLCEEVGLMKTYIILEIVIILLTLITLLVIFILSFRGSVVNTKKRRHIVPLWLIVAILTIFDAVCAVLGSIWTFGYGLKENCYSLGSHQYVVRLLIGVVVCQWVMLLVVILVLFCIYTRVGKLYKETPIMRRRPSRRASAFRRGHLKHSRIWMNRCKVLSCHCNCGSAPSEGRSTAFTEVSQLLARYFEEYDLVPSDIAVGLILLRRQYQTEKRALKQSISSVSSIGKVMYNINW